MERFDYPQNIRAYYRLNHRKTELDTLLYNYDDFNSDTV